MVGVDDTTTAPPVPEPDPSEVIDESLANQNAQTTIGEITPILCGDPSDSSIVFPELPPPTGWQRSRIGANLAYVQNIDPDPDYDFLHSLITIKAAAWFRYLPFTQVNV